jgi:hypothetical protein
MLSVPMILETPAPEQKIWAEEIKLLYWMVGKETGDMELLGQEIAFQEKGREDREKQLDVVRRKAEKAQKVAKSPGRKKKGQQSVASSDSEKDESEEESC